MTACVGSICPACDRSTIDEHGRCPHCDSPVVYPLKGCAACKHLGAYLGNGPGSKR